MKRCPYCLESNDDEAFFCQYCGKKFSVEKPVNISKSEVNQIPTHKNKISTSLIGLWNSNRKVKIAFLCGISFLMMSCCLIFASLFSTTPENKATATYEKAMTETISYESTMQVLVSQFLTTQETNSSPITEATPFSVPAEEITIPDNSEMACIPRNTKRETGIVTSVVDGDTIHVLINGVDFSVRYIGMDSPEGTDYYGPEATNYNKQLVEGKNIILVNDVSETDVYDRLLRYVIVDNRFVNYELVKNGFAISKSYPPDTACDQINQEAQNQISAINGGLWSYQPSPTSAQVVIAATSEPVVITPTIAGSCPHGCMEQLPGCAIKGNINDDEKIYHVPGSTYYERTKIDPTKGERWFCTEAEALANGWRAPLN